MGEPSALDYARRKGRPSALRPGTNLGRVLSGGTTPFYARIYASFFDTLRCFDCAFDEEPFSVATYQRRFIESESRRGR